jgi:hypothetical protein
MKNFLLRKIWQISIFVFSDATRCQTHSPSPARLEISVIYQKEALFASFMPAECAVLTF